VSAGRDPVASGGPTVASPLDATGAALGVGPRRRWLAVAVLFGVAVLVFVVTRSDVRQLRETARGVVPVLLLLPALATVASYLVMARSYQGIAAAAGYRVPFLEMLRITLVANTANYLVAAGGLSGFALRMYLFVRRGIPAGSAVLISLVQTLITNLALLVFVIGGFVLLLLSHVLVGRELLVAAVLLGGFSGVVLLATLLILRRRLRRRLLFGATRLLHVGWRWLSPRRAPRRLALLRFQRNLNAGLDFLLDRPHEMLMPTWYIVLDWVCTLLVLYTAFLAIGHPVSPSYVVAGFAIGMFFSIVSLVPAGLGVLEGSMAAVFASLDVPLERAVIAVLIFRAAYYGLPLLASAAFARSTLRS
jgi:uncharacterized protein (TIRG00374 family)